MFIMGRLQTIFQSANSGLELADSIDDSRADPANIGVWVRVS